MNSGELQLLRSTVKGVLTSKKGRDVLPALGTLGLLGLLVPEDGGGAGWCPVEAAVIADEIGRAASFGGAGDAMSVGSAAPWLTASVAAAALASGGAARGWLPGTLDGTTPVVAVRGTVRRTGDVVDGTLVGVEAADHAPAVVVLGERDSISIVDLRSPGVTMRAEPTAIDTTRSLWRVELAAVASIDLGRVGHVHDVARMLAAATSLGSLRAAIERLVPYLSDRVAFGSPIASFQAIQHRIVDLFLIEVRAGVAVDAAARAMATDPVGGSRLAAVAHGFVAERVPPALDECIQLTGGIGFTWEYPLHHELRRSVADGAVYGSARASREHLLTALGWA